MDVIDFWDRAEDLAKIKQCAGKSVFGYVTGRRRIGKTALLVRACETLGGFYHQAVEGTASQQLIHLAEDIQNRWPVFGNVVPKSWSEFFALLSREKLPPLIVFDEFPYWVGGDPMLPSLLQKWIDHELPKKKTLVLVSGSSQSMLHSQFLKASSPLYGRAMLHLHLNHMPYRWFCKALEISSADPDSFERFSLVGGVPHYWKLMAPTSTLSKTSLMGQATALYFEPVAILAEEPGRILQDEGVTGSLPKAILDFVGRGVSRPSELASRLGTAHGNLSRPLALLLELGLIQKELPFGESARTTKKVIYSIEDPAVAFYYGTYLRLRSQWTVMSSREKRETIHQHASKQWEIFCRHSHFGSSRYWEGDIELDLVAPLGKKEGHLIAECKWKPLTKAEEDGLIKDLRARFYKTSLSRKLPKVSFKIFSQNSLVHRTEPLLAIRTPV